LPITAPQLQSLALKKLKRLKISLFDTSLIDDVDAPVTSWYCHGTSLGTWQLKCCAVENTRHESITLRRISVKLQLAKQSAKFNYS